jgi:hypothetical protein
MEEEAEQNNALREHAAEDEVERDELPATRRSFASPANQCFSHFVDHVRQDFHDARDDMNHAVANVADMGPSAQHIVANTVGVVVAARFVPVRLARLASRRVAVAAGAALVDPRQPAREAVPVATVTEDAENPEPPSTTTSQTSGECLEECPEQHSSGSQVDHFKEQVRKDFVEAKGEVQAAFEDLLAAGQAIVSARSARDQELAAQICQHVEEMRDAGIGIDMPAPTPTARTQPSYFREAVPDILSSITGVIVATTLTPIRCARLAAAKMASCDE